MATIILFGLPGVGKTFIGKIMQQEFGWFFYDGDQDIPSDMKDALFKNQVISEDMRDRFFQNLLTNVENIHKDRKHIVVAQTFLKEKYRYVFLQAFPNVEFILVTAREDIRRIRYKKRKEWFLGSDYERKMVSLFDAPKIPHSIFENSFDGKKEVKKQLHRYFSAKN